MAKGIPVIAVMWYMLKDLRTTVNGIAKKITEMEIKVASDQNGTKIGFLEAQIRDIKESSKIDDERIQTRLHDLEKQMPLVWGKIGDRPEDLATRRSARS